MVGKSNEKRDGKKDEKRDYSNLRLIRNFGIANMPNLDVCVLGALELFMKEKLPSFKIDKFKRPLVIGSGNAYVTGQIIFDSCEAIFANENNYKNQANIHKNRDVVVIISSSGGKHSIEISKFFKNSRVPVFLITNNKNAPAGKFINQKNIIVYPCNREPYTYNTSTYLGYILSRFDESPEKIYDFIKKEIEPIMPDKLFNQEAFLLTIPPKFELMKYMFNTKFFELFGRKIPRDVFTTEESKHASNVVPGNELFIDFGGKSPLNEKNTLTIPLPKWINYGSLMAIGYFIIGKIQAVNYPYFKTNISDYCRKASVLFGQKIKEIAEF